MIGQEQAANKNLVKSRKIEQYKVLLIDALTFLKQNIPETSYPIPNGILKVAEGIITWFKVLQRDCPSFVANYYFDFVNLIPE